MLRNAVKTAESVRPAQPKRAGQHNSNFMPKIEGGSLPYTIERDLPNPLASKRQQRLYFVLFCLTMGLSLFGFVKYEAASSPIVTSTLYTLRRSKLAQEHLGETIRFASTMPWITGNTGIAAKDLDFSYKAVGNKTGATVHFSASKVAHEARYAVKDWSLTLDNGQKVDLIDDDFHPFVPGPKEEPGMQRRQ